MRLATAIRHHFLFWLCCVFAIGFGAATPAQAADISGQYRIDGQNPGGGGYRGEAVIAVSGETYQVVWIIGKTRHTGTGILIGDTLSVVYQASGSKPGVAAYVIERDGTLLGRWVGLGERAVGIERWSRKDGA